MHALPLSERITGLASSEPSIDASTSTPTREGLHGQNMRAHLNTRRPPWDEAAQLPLTDTLKRLVHLSRVHIALDNVENGDVAAAILPRRAGDHDILCLQIGKVG